jgi:nicotinate-nucleotide pyrophosphorylase (carboxylating)
MDLPYLTKEAIRAFIRAALAEDIGSGDHSSLGAIPATATSRAHLRIKADGIIAGLEMARYIFEEVSPDLRVKFLKKDGDAVTTHGMNLLIKGTNTRLLDTRKTTPNFRMAEKWAVAIGGGVNHRFGLYDMVMLKDNHIDMAGGVKAAITSTVDYLTKNNLDLKIEVEVRSLKELEDVLETGHVHRVMLDNMLPSDIKRAITMIDGRFETEASGGITESNIQEMAETGVDFISVGALTHSYKSLDMSLKAF